MGEIGQNENNNNEIEKINNLKIFNTNLNYLCIYSDEINDVIKTSFRLIDSYTLPFRFLFFF